MKDATLRFIGIRLAIAVGLVILANFAIHLLIGIPLTALVTMIASIVIISLLKKVLLIRAFCLKCAVSACARRFRNNVCLGNVTNF